jgi:hypothetical protein
LCQFGHGGVAHLLDYSVASGTALHAPRSPIIVKYITNLQLPDCYDTNASAIDEDDRRPNERAHVDQRLQRPLTRRYQTPATVSRPASDAQQELFVSG